jgi:N-acetylglutamate synthase-like GNAT family acetyltransferase
VSLRVVEPGTAAFEAFEGLLAASGLPTEDLLAEPARYFALDDGAAPPAAYAGLLRLAEEALLRSVVVRPGERGGGAGGRIVEMASALAAEEGAQRLWLLTEGAENFFARRGWREVPREAAPPALAASRQFATTCPASAVLMCRTLA